MSSKNADTSKRLKMQFELNAKKDHTPQKAKNYNLSRTFFEGSTQIAATELMRRLRTTLRFESRQKKPFFCRFLKKSHSAGNNS